MYVKLTFAKTKFCYVCQNRRSFRIFAKIEKKDFHFTPKQVVKASFYVENKKGRHCFEKNEEETLKALAFWSPMLFIL